MTLLAYITFPEQEAALTMAMAMLEARLAAGAHVDGPVTAIYRWQGQICRREEWRLVAQISRKNFQRLQDFVLARHSYEVPCIMAVDLAGGYGPFLEWIEKSGD